MPPVYESRNRFSREIRLSRFGASPPLDVEDFNPYIFAQE